MILYFFSQTSDVFAAAGGVTLHELVDRHTLHDGRRVLIETRFIFNHFLLLPFYSWVGVNLSSSLEKKNPVPMSLEFSTDEDGTVVLILPNKSKVIFSAGLMSLESIKRCIVAATPRPSGPGGVQVLWSLIPKRPYIHYLYDCLVAHGVPVTPSKNEAITAWGDLQSNATGTPSSRSGALVTTTTDAGDALPVGASPAVRVGDLSELLAPDESAGTFNHLWCLRDLLGFPHHMLEMQHAAISTDMVDRIGKFSPQPRICTYQINGSSSAPLLVWFRVHEHRVTALLQEYMHLCYPNVRETRVWTWLMIPRGMNVDVVSDRFASYRILPSIRGLLHYGLSDATRHRTIKLNLPELETWAGRLGQDPERRHMHTVYQHGATALWLGDDVFFCVEGADIMDISLPHSVDQLPPWVLPFIQREEQGDLSFLPRNINSYLGLFDSEKATDAVNLLRRVNWGVLPLHWQPIFLRSLPICVTEEESREAHVRLLKTVAPDKVYEDAEVLAQATKILHDICGLRER